MTTKKPNRSALDILYKAMPAILVAAVIAVGSIICAGISSKYATASKVSANDRRIYSLEVGQTYTQRDLKEIKQGVLEIKSFLFNGQKPSD